ncbi:hypothetical protein GE278_16125 [Enterobacteriaceae bacterium Kacie_13]|nr:hypothetical protein GE278_16125 [Enterobacteriaceae bacterium Kacie_13]
MQLDASGKMALRNSAAAGALVANAQEMQLAGNHHAQSMTLSSIGDMQLQNATLASNGNLSVTSGGLIQTVGTQLTSGQDGQWHGQLTAGQDVQLTSSTFTQQGKITANRNATFSGKQLSNHGDIQTQGNLSLNLDIFNNTGQALSGGVLAISAQNTDLSGTLSAQQDLTFTGNSLHLNQGGQLLAGQKLDLTASSLRIEGEANGAQSISLNSALFTSTQNSVLTSDGDIVLHHNEATIDGLIAAKGTLAAGNTLQASTTGSFTQNGTVQGQSVALSSTGSFSNQATLTGGNGAFMINAGSTIQSDNGSLQSGGDVSLISRGAITNSGLLYSASDMTMFADRISNLKGDILAGNSLWMIKDASENGVKSADIIFPE